MPLRVGGWKWGMIPDESHSPARYSAFPARRDIWFSRPARYLVLPAGEISGSQTGLWLARYLNQRTKSRPNFTVAGEISRNEACLRRATPGVALHWPPPPRMKFLSNLTPAQDPPSWRGTPGVALHSKRWPLYLATPCYPPARTEGNPTDFSLGIE